MNETQLETRIQELFDGALDDQHLPALKEQLHTSEKARQLYCTYARIHGLLHQRSRALQGIDAPLQLMPLDDIAEIRKRNTLRYSALATAAVLLFSFIVLYQKQVTPPPPSLTFTNSPGTIFTTTHLSDSEKPPADALISGSSLTLSQGFTKLTFRSGVESIVRAPAEFEVTDDNTLHLHQGTAWFRVPQQAVGFTVTTKDMEIVDLGTEFGVIEKKGKRSQVQVFEGSVQATSKHPTIHTETLTAAQSRSVTTSGQLISTNTTPEAFSRQLPDSLPYLYWDFDAANSVAFSPTHNSLTSTPITGITPDAIPTTTNSPRATGLTGTKGTPILTNWKGLAGNRPRSIAFWVKTPQQDKYLQHLVGWGKYSPDYNGDAFYCFLSGLEQEHEVGLSINGLWVKSSLPESREWNHVVFTYNGQNYDDSHPVLRSYINGKEVATSSHIPDSNTNQTYPAVRTVTDHHESQPLTFFGNPHHYVNSDPSSASIDELYIFDGCIDQKHILKLAKQAKSK